MRRIHLILTLAALAAVPALAQMQVFIPKPAPAQTAPPQIQMSPQQAPTFDPALTPETARAAIAKLQARNKELRGQMAVTLGDLQAVRTQLDEMTRAGGMLVHAQCASPELSRRTDGGGEENCSASGYACSAVEGTCFRQCSTTTQCAGGFVCDTSASRCVVPTSGDDG